MVGRYPWHDAPGVPFVTGLFWRGRHLALANTLSLFIYLFIYLWTGFVKHNTTAQFSTPFNNEKRQNPAGVRRTSGETVMLIDLPEKVENKCTNSPLYAKVHTGSCGCQGEFKVRRQTLTRRHLQPVCDHTSRRKNGKIWIVKINKNKVHDYKENKYRGRAGSSN